MNNPLELAQEDDLNHLILNINFSESKNLKVSEENFWFMA